MPLQYKFVELSIVTDEKIEETVNEWVRQGWLFEGIRFVTTEHSKRPSMAFVSFTREAEQKAADTEPPRRPPPLVKPEPDGYEEGQLPQIHTSPDEPAVILAGHGDDVD